MKLRPSNPFRPQVLTLAAVLTLTAPTTFADVVNASASVRVLSGTQNGNDTGALSLYNDGGNVQRSFLDFNLSSYSGKSITTDATMTLTAGIYGDYLTGVILGTANSAWTQAGITWNNQPGITAISGATNPSGTFGSGSVTWNIPWFMLEKMATTGSGYNNGLGITSGSGSSQHFQAGSNPTLTFTAATAASSTWSGGNGNWTDTANWAGNTVAEAIGQSAAINGGSAVNITMNANRSVGSLAFSGADHSIISGTGKLALNVVSGSPAVSVETGRIATIGATVVGIDGLTKTGPGTLTLTGNNTYGGTTTVSTGTLQIGNGGTTGSLGSGNVSIAGNLTFNRSNNYGTGSSQVFSGAGTITKEGAGELVFNGGSDHTNVQGISNVVVNDGLIRTDYWGQWNSNLNLTVNGSGKFEMWNTSVSLANLSGNGTVQNTVDWGRAVSLTVAAGSFSGAITDPGGGNKAINLVKTGSGTLTLSGSNSYTGGTTVNGGRLILENNLTGSRNYTTNAELEFKLTTGNQLIKNGTFSGTGKLIKTGGSELTLGEWDGGQTVALKGADSVIDVQEGKLSNFYGAGPWAPSINWTGNEAGLTVASGATFELSMNSVTVDELNGSGTINKGMVDASATLTIGVKDGSGTFNGVITATGSLLLVKQGSGTQTLSGTNTYSGTTTVSGGKLEVTGSIANSAVTVNGAGTVLASGTTGTIGKGVTVNSGAILAAGGRNTVGTATVGSDGLSFASGSIFEWDLATSKDANDAGGNNGVGGTDFDSVSVTGNLAADTTGAIFKVIFGASALVDIANPENTFWHTASTPQTWNMMALFGKDFTTNAFSSVQTSSDVASYGSFSINGSSLTWTAVPEPTSALAGLLITAGLLRRRRCA